MATSPVTLDFSKMVPIDQPAAPAPVTLDFSKMVPIDQATRRPAPSQPSLSDNPNGEGIYQMKSPQGQTVGVPYSKVGTARNQNFEFANQGTQQQWQKDSQADTSSGSIQPMSYMDRLEQVRPDVEGDSYLKRAANLFGNVGAAGIATLHHPLDSMYSMAKSVIPGTDTPNPVSSLYTGLNTQPSQTVAGLLGSSAAMGLYGEVASPVVGAGANLGRRFAAGDVNAPIPGSTVTPASRYAAMQSMGISPDAAEATNSPVLGALKKFNENSLTASPIYADAQRSNVGKLDLYTGKTLNEMSPLPPEAGGAEVQRGLLAHHAELKSQATQGFTQLDDQLGNQPILGAPGLRNTARRILSENAPYYNLHPELEPTKAMSIVKDIAGTKDLYGRPRTPNVVTGFGPTPEAPSPVPPRDWTYGEMHRMRSDLLDFNNNNPDLVKNQASGWISQLAGAADNAITNPGSLTRDQVQTFRGANDAWKQMKDTYDNPQNSLYHAVRSPQPSTLVQGISRTPEMAQTLQTALGPEGMGPVQRGVAERALGTTKEGNYNFKNFQGNFNKLPPTYRNTLYNGPQLESLNNVGQAGTVLNTDLNPSGSAKLGQAIGEGATAVSSFANPHALPALGLYHAAQFGVARAMNNPAFVQWLMSQEPVKTPNFGLYTGAGGAAKVDRR